MPPPSASRYRRPPGRGRRLLFGLLAVLAYAGAAGLTVVALRDLEGWGVLGAGALGLLVALLVVVGRSAVAAARPPDAPSADAPAPGTRPRPSSGRTPQGGRRARR